ncbi:ribonuclease T2 family protein [Fulvimarina endophytica]|nr:ribonuclease [Fulvimarina endophytica]
MTTRRRIALFSCIAGLMVAFGLLAGTSALAQDLFLADKTCPAFQSFRKGTNPNGVTTEIGRSYEVIEANGSDPTHYRLRIQAAEPPERWVSRTCGVLSRGSGDGAVRPKSGNADIASPPASSRARDASAPERFVLAASWHAAFCEARPRSRDCRTGGYDDGLKLHGLWPQPRSAAYCGVASALVEADERGRWAELPEPRIEASTRRALAEAMPGMAADLHRHEWIKHGTCYGTGVQDYFADSLLLIEQLNASPVGALFRDNVGRTLTGAEIRATFDEAFGPGAGERVLLDCNTVDGLRLINELRINLRGTIEPDTRLEDLIMAAEEAPRGCSAGIVDAKG